jgi:hypothetical protein
MKHGEKIDGRDKRLTSQKSVINVELTTSSSSQSAYVIGVSA